MPVIEIRADARGRWFVLSEDEPPGVYGSETAAERAAFVRASGRDDSSVVLYDRYMRPRVLTRERPVVRG
jgi:hypothetical protein